MGLERGLHLTYMIPIKNPINELQEYVLTRHKTADIGSCITYSYPNEPVSACYITLKVPINGIYGSLGVCYGLNNQQAKETAAKEALELLKKAQNDDRCPIDNCNNNNDDDSVHRHLHYIMKMLKK